MDEFNAWQASSVIQGQIERHMGGDLLRLFRWEADVHHLSCVLAWGFVKDMEQASQMSDAALMSIRGMTIHYLRIVRLTWFYMTGEGESQMVRHELGRVMGQIELLEQQDAAIRRRIGALRSRMAVLLDQDGLNRRRDAKRYGG